jgi:uncharacterized Fe-S center protein
MTEKSEVIYIKEGKKADEIFLKTLKSEISQVFKPGETIAIKMHLGEANNFNNLQPDFVAKIANVFKELKINCFLFDSTTKYKGERFTVEGYEALAKRRRYDKIAEVVISNTGIKKKGKYMNHEVCKELIGADGVLILSHVKGHECSGFGASIKNLGMGALTGKGKTEIHNGGSFKFNSKLCSSCGNCEKICCTKNITCQTKDGKPQFGLTKCFGCSLCSLNCPTKAITPKVNIFDLLLADGGITALKSFKKYYCVNVMRKIVKLCDCCPDGKEVIAKDAGILLSRDIVSIDRAALDIITKAEGKNIFEEIHHKNPMLHIQEAHDLGADSLEYNLKEVK